MKNNLFVVVLKYIVSLETIDAHRAAHLKFLDNYYSYGILLASGPQAPRVGGVIIAKCSSKETLEKILENDPFWINNLAEYQILEFTPAKHAPCLNAILNEDRL